MNAQFRKASKTQSFECPLFSCGKSKILKEKTTWSVSCSCYKCGSLQICFEIEIDPLVNPVQKHLICLIPC